MAEEMYSPEKRLLGRKAASLVIKWNEMPVMDQLVSDPMPAAEAEAAYAKLTEGLKKGAGARIRELMKKVEAKNSKIGAFRIVIVVSVLRQLFADELGDWGGGGRGLRGDNKPNPLSMTLNRR